MSMLMVQAGTPAKAPPVGQPRACQLRIPTIAGNIIIIAIIYLTAARDVKNTGVAKSPAKRQVCRHVRRCLAAIVQDALSANVATSELQTPRASHIDYLFRRMFRLESVGAK